MQIVDTFIFIDKNYKTSVIKNAQKTAAEKYLFSESSEFLLHWSFDAQLNSDDNFLVNRISHCACVEFETRPLEQPPLPNENKKKWGFDFVSQFSIFILSI